MHGSAPFDLLAFVTRPSFSSRRGPIGDYLELMLFKRAHPELSVCVIEFNDPEMQVDWNGAALSLIHPRFGATEVGCARLVLYMPVSFEPEDIAMRPHAGYGSQAIFAHRQWRVVSDFLEIRLASHPNCINNPRRARFACNKLAQLEQLRQAGIVTLPIRVTQSTSTSMDGAQVCKNLSEGAIIASGEFSNTPSGQFGPAARLSDDTSVLHRVRPRDAVLCYGSRSHSGAASPAACGRGDRRP
jgi:hypothetical protein